MDTMSNDELNDQRLADASKELFEVTADAQLELDDEDEEGCSDEYPFGKSKDILQADEQALKLHAECSKFGDKFRSLCREIDTYAPYIIALKRKFGVKKGYAGHKVSFPDFPNGVYWSEYCDEVFDLTPTRVNQLINHKDEKPDNLRRPKPLEERADYLKGKERGYQQAHDEMLAKGVDVKASKSIADLVEEDEDDAPKFADDDPYSYWSQLDKDAPTFAKEVLAMMEEVGLDSQQISQVIEQMKKQHKPSMKPLNSRFATSAAAAA